MSKSTIQDIYVDADKRFHVFFIETTGDSVDTVLVAPMTIISQDPLIEVPDLTQKEYRVYLNGTELGPQDFALTTWNDAGTYKITLQLINRQFQPGDYVVILEGTKLTDDDIQFTENSRISAAKLNQIFDKIRARMEELQAAGFSFASSTVFRKLADAIQNILSGFTDSAKAEIDNYVETSAKPAVDAEAQTQITNIQTEGQNQISAIQNEGATQISNIQTTGQTWYDLLLEAAQNGGGGGGAQVVLDTQFPSNPTEGMFFYHTEYEALYIYVNGAWYIVAYGVPLEGEPTPAVPKPTPLPEEEIVPVTFNLSPAALRGMGYDPSDDAWYGINQMGEVLKLDNEFNMIVLADVDSAYANQLRHLAYHNRKIYYYRRPGSATTGELKCVDVDTLTTTLFFGGANTRFFDQLMGQHLASGRVVTVTANSSGDSVFVNFTASPPSWFTISTGIAYSGNWGVTNESPVGINPVAMRRSNTVDSIQLVDSGGARTTFSCRLADYSYLGSAWNFVTKKMYTFYSTAFMLEIDLLTRSSSLFELPITVGASTGLAGVDGKTYFGIYVDPGRVIQLDAETRTITIIHTWVGAPYQHKILTRPTDGALVFLNMKGSEAVIWKPKINNDYFQAYQDECYWT